MLWQKSWWETRWGVLLFMGVTLLFVFWRPSESQWVSSLQKHASIWSEDSRRLLPLLSSHQGYVWSYWFKMALLGMWPVYAVAQASTLAAASCPWMAGGVGAAGLFTFSLPVSRRKVPLTHAALVIAEMALVALAPSLMFPIISYLTGADVSFGSVVIHALLLSLGGTVFISLTFLLTAVFNSQLKVMVIGIVIALGLFFPLIFRSPDEFPWWNVYHVMSGETYFRYGRIPWIGLFTSLAVSALMLFAAVRIYERRDF
jgi:hypothetical protein